MIDDMLSILKSRRSIRKFKEDGLTKEEVEKLLKAGLFAPSSMNKRPVEFVLLEDRETIKSLKSCKSYGTAGLDTAPCTIAVIADREKSDVWVEDASIAATMMQLEAESLGLGSVWIQIRNRSSETGDSEAEVKKALHIPERYGVLSLLAFGQKAEEKEPHKDEELDFSAVHQAEF